MAMSVFVKVSRCFFKSLKVEKSSYRQLYKFNIMMGYDKNMIITKLKLFIMLPDQDNSYLLDSVIIIHIHVPYNHVL